MIEPVGKHLLLLQIKQEEKKNGIIVPNEKKQVFWKVCKSGSEVSNNYLGKTVFINPYHQGNAVEHDNVQYTIVHEEKVLAVLHE